jgi:anti-anti-sigma regulatory factor
LPVTLKTSEGAGSICLEGVIDIGCAAELKALLMEGLGAGRGLKVSIEGVTAMDAAAAQLLWAAEREASGAGTEWAIEGQLPEPVRAEFVQAGFVGFLSSEKVG